MSASPKNCGAHEFEFRGASSHFGERDESPIYDFTGWGGSANRRFLHPEGYVSTPVCLFICLFINKPKM